MTTKKLIPVRLYLIDCDAKTFSFHRIDGNHVELMTSSEYLTFWWMRSPITHLKAELHRMLVESFIVATPTNLRSMAKHYSNNLIYNANLAVDLARLYCPQDAPYAIAFLGADDWNDKQREKAREIWAAWRRSTPSSPTSSTEVDGARVVYADHDSVFVLLEDVLHVSSRAFEIACLALKAWRSSASISSISSTEAMVQHAPEQQQQQAQVAPVQPVRSSTTSDAAEEVPSTRSIRCYCDIPKIGMCYVEIQFPVNATELDISQFLDAWKEDSTPKIPKEWFDSVFRKRLCPLGGRFAVGTADELVNFPRPHRCGDIAKEIGDACRAAMYLCPPNAPHAIVFLGPSCQIDDKEVLSVYGEWLNSFKEATPPVEAAVQPTPASPVVSEQPSTKPAPTKLKPIMCYVIENSTGEIHCLDFPTGRMDLSQDAFVAAWTNELKTTYSFITAGYLAGEYTIGTSTGLVKQFRQFNISGTAKTAAEAFFFAQQMTPPEAPYGIVFLGTSNQSEKQRVSMDLVWTSWLEKFAPPTAPMAEAKAESAPAQPTDSTPIKPKRRPVHCYGITPDGVLCHVELSTGKATQEFDELGFIVAWQAEVDRRNAVLNMTIPEWLAGSYVVFGDDGLKNYYVGYMRTAVNTAAVACREAQKLTPPDAPHCIVFLGERRWPAKQVIAVHDLYKLWRTDGYGTPTQPMPTTSKIQDGPTQPIFAPSNAKVVATALGATPTERLAPVCVYMIHEGFVAKLKFEEDAALTGTHYFEALRDQLPNFDVSAMWHMLNGERLVGTDNTLVGVPSIFNDPVMNLNHAIDVARTKRPLGASEGIVFLGVKSYTADDRAEMHKIFSAWQSSFAPTKEDKTPVPTPAQVEQRDPIAQWRETALAGDIADEEMATRYRLALAEKINGIHGIRWDVTESGHPVFLRWVRELRKMKTNPALVGHPVRFAALESIGFKFKDPMDLRMLEPLDTAQAKEYVCRTLLLPWVCDKQQKD